MLSQANHQGPVWAVKQAAAPEKAATCSDARMECQEATQAPGCSPSSNSSCAMEYSCSMPATPAGQDEQHNCSDNTAEEFTGWFAKCRGCGCMTAHEKLIKDADVPFCRRCQHTLATACPAMQQKMVDTLLYVHTAWSNAGL